MEWILLIILGAAIGFILSPIARLVHVPIVISVAVGSLGAVIGAAVDEAAGFEPFGRATDFIAGGVVSVGCLIGMVLAFALTRDWKQARFGS